MLRNFNFIARQIHNKSLTPVKYGSLISTCVFVQRLRGTPLFEKAQKYYSLETFEQLRKMSTTEELYYQHQFAPELELAINEQIQAEQQAGQEFLNMAVYFLHPSVSCPGTGSFFMRRYEEEIGHMKHNIIKYQLRRGGKVVTPCLGNPPSHDKLTMLGAFKLALQMEKKVTELILNIINTAEKVKDHECAHHFTTKYLSEQKKSVHNLAHHLTKLTRLEAAGEHALLSYDIKLAKYDHYAFKK